MILSKVSFNLHQPNGGYSHNTQVYNFYRENLKFILAYKNKKLLLRHLKKKNKQKPTFNFTKIKRRVVLRPSLQARTTSLTFISVNNSHFMTHTSIIPWPHVFDIRAQRVRKFYKKQKKIKNLYRTRQLVTYHKSIVEQTARLCTV